MAPDLGLLKQLASSTAHAVCSREKECSAEPSLAVPGHTFVPVIVSKRKPGRQEQIHSKAEADLICSQGSLSS